MSAAAPGDAASGDGTSRTAGASAAGPVTGPGAGPGAGSATRTPPAPPAPRPLRHGARNGRAAAVFLAPFAAFFLLTFAAPILYALYQSLLRPERSGPLGLGRAHTVFAGLGNYEKALSDSQFLAGFGRVLLFALVQIPVMTVLATALALLLEAASARWVGFFRTAFFLPYGVPGVIASILWGFLYVPGISPLVEIARSVGWDVDFLSRSTVLWSIANIVTWQFTGYNMLVLIAQLKAVPRELYEAARIDGASAWQTARHIKLPLIRPALVLTTVFSIIGTIQLFAEPMVLKPLATAIDSGFTPNLHAYQQAFKSNDQYGAAAEAVLIALVACVLSFGFLRLVGGGDTGGDRNRGARGANRSAERDTGKYRARHGNREGSGDMGGGTGDGAGPKAGAR